MVSITKQYRTETGHRLCSKDAGACANVHGHSYLWDVTVSGPVSEETGMIINFKELKKILERCIGDYDHTLVLNWKDPILYGTPAYNCLGILYEIEPYGRIILMDGDPTAENMVQEVAKNVMDRLPFGTQLQAITVWETDTSCATWERRD